MSLRRRFDRLLKDLLDRLAHPSRRRAALARLRITPLPRSVLLVCQGNLCRSPYAEAALRRRLESMGLQVRVQSAGFSVPNRAPPAEAIDTASERGLDIANHRSRIVGEAPRDPVDMILVMEPWMGHAVTHRVRGRVTLALGDLDPQTIRTRRIADPVGAGRTAFEDCYDRIDRCLDELVQAMGSAPRP